MGQTRTLLIGIAEHLQSLGLGTWNESGIYADGQIGIVLGLLPDQPAAVIALSGYSVSDDPSLSDSVTGVQVRTRTGSANPTVTDDLADSIFDALHGATNLDLGVRVAQILRQSWTPLGLDGNRRAQRSDNYYLTLHAPSAHRQ